MSDNSNGAADCTKRAIQKMMINSLGERDFSAQETMHHLLSLKLHTSSFTVIPVCLDGSRRLRQNSNECTGIQSTNNSLLYIYAKRESFKCNDKHIVTLNLTDFVTKYKISGSNLVARPPKCVPRFFPTNSSNPAEETFPLFCKCQLLRYKPWKITQNNAWDDLESTNEVFITCWEQFLRTPYAQNHVPQWSSKLANVEQLELKIR